MYLNTATIRFPYHTVYIKVDHVGRIHCFKFNARTCDFDVFDNQFDAGDYILEPLPTIYYQVTVQEE
jgi:hypothetical protein